MNIFIIGSKGIPANYGGFETFVEKLTEYKKNIQINYHISCLSYENNEEFYHNNARCFNVKVPNIGSASAVVYDILSLGECIKYIRKHSLKNSVIYILACRIGPFMNLFKKQINDLNIQILVNPDGHEWKRSKWNKFIRNYWKYSEKLMIKNSDLIICDSKGIQAYIKQEYSMYKPNTDFVAYGADLTRSSLHDDSKEYLEWLNINDLCSNEFYLIVGRFVPENNYELMIREFMKSNTKKDLVIISNIVGNNFYQDLLNKTKFDTDKRIKFVGTVYEQNLLKKIRENAYGYLHGHEVGGTNPSLLEALASTKLNLLLDVVFNNEVGQEAALYFSRDEGSLSKLIETADLISSEEILTYGKMAFERIESEYTWELIVEKYEFLFFDAVTKNIETKNTIPKGVVEV